MTAPRCDVCDRRVYLAEGDLPLCPVCSTPLVESGLGGSAQEPEGREADVA